MKYIDPRVKLFFLGIVMCFAGYTNNSWTLFFFSALTVLILAFAQIRLSHYLIMIKPVSFLVLTMLLFQLIFNHGGKLLIDLHIVQVYSGALLQASFFAVKIFCVMLCFLSVIFTTTTMQIIAGFERIFSCFNSKFIPAHKLSLILSMIIKFLESLTVQFHRIRKAHIARGSRLDTGNIIDRIKGYSRILIPTVWLLFIRSHELALALLTRGYSSDRVFSGHAKKLIIKSYDLYFLLTLIILLITFLLVMN